jgi:hypothetical protein
MKTSHLREFQARLRSIVGSGRLDRDFDDELATHLELLIRERVNRSG